MYPYYLNKLNFNLKKVLIIPKKDIFFHCLNPKNFEKLLVKLKNLFAKIRAFRKMS